MKKVLNWVRTHKRIALIALLFISFTASATAFAWWNSIQETDGVTIPIGAGDQIILKISLEEQTNLALVPSDVAYNVDTQTQEVIIEFDVNLEGTTGPGTVSGSLDLSVTYNNVLIGDSDDHNDLVNITIKQGVLNNEDILRITVTVTLDRPDTQAVYDAIKNQDITFDVIFTATEKSNN